MTKLDWIARPIRGSDWQNKTKAESFMQAKTTFTFRPKISEYAPPEVSKNDTNESSVSTPKKSVKK